MHECDFNLFVCFGVSDDGTAHLSSLHAAESQIIACSLIPFMVLIPVDSEGNPMQPYHR